MAGMLERRALGVVTPKQGRDGAGIAFAPILEQRQGAVAMTEKTQHRRHAVARIQQRMRRLQIHRRQGVHHHHQMAISMQQTLRRTADMAAIRQNLARDFRFQAGQPHLQPFG